MWQVLVLAKWKGSEFAALYWQQYDADMCPWKMQFSLLAVLQAWVSLFLCLQWTSLLSCPELIHVINDVALPFLITSASVLREMTEITSQKGNTWTKEKLQININATAWELES